jgi:hypothetical protein
MIRDSSYYWTARESLLDMRSHIRLHAYGSYDGPDGPLLSPSEMEKEFGSTRAVVALAKLRALRNQSPWLNRALAELHQQPKSGTDSAHYRQRMPHQPGLVASLRTASDQRG